MIVKLLHTILEILVNVFFIVLWACVSGALTLYGVILLFTPLFFYANILTRISAAVALISGIVGLICGGIILRKHLS